MSIAKIKIDEQTKLEFAISITGAGGVPQSRFIIEGKDYSIAFPCRQTNEGVEVDIHGLKNMFTAGDYQATLEVFLENKVYTPLKDTITLEPSVEITTKTKPVLTKESVKVEKVTVKKSVINEDLLRKTQAATIIAKSLGYTPEETETPRSIIENSIKSQSALSNDQRKTLQEMLKLAESVGIEYDQSLYPLIVEEKKPPSGDDMSEEELDDIVNSIDSFDDIDHAYDDDELSIVDQETGEELKEEFEESGEINEVLSRSERLKSRIRFARTASKRMRNMQIALRKHSSAATINNRARRVAVKAIEQKLARGKDPKNLTPAEKERIERIIQKRSKAIGRLALKLVPRIKKIEKDRLTHATFTRK